MVYLGCIWLTSIISGHLTGQICFLLYIVMPFLILCFLLFHILCVRISMAPAKLHEFSHEPSLFAYVIITLFTWPGSFCVGTAETGSFFKNRIVEANKAVLFLKKDSGIVKGSK